MLQSNSTEYCNVAPHLDHTKEPSNLCLGIENARAQHEISKRCGTGGISTFCSLQKLVISPLKCITVKDVICELPALLSHFEVYFCIDRIQLRARQILGAGMMAPW